MENCSLSVRIRRRNKCSFKGVGTESNWKKSSMYGSLVKKFMPNKYQSAINRLRKWGHRRSGTKKAKVLSMYMN